MTEFAIPDAGELIDPSIFARSSSFEGSFDKASASAAERSFPSKAPATITPFLDSLMNFATAFAGATWSSKPSANAIGPLKVSVNTSKSLPLTAIFARVYYVTT